MMMLKIRNERKCRQGTVAFQHAADQHSNSVFFQHTVGQQVPVQDIVTRMIVCPRCAPAFERRIMDDAIGERSELFGNWCAVQGFDEVKMELVGICPAQRLHQVPKVNGSGAPTGTAAPQNLKTDSAIHARRTVSPAWAGSPKISRRPLCRRAREYSFAIVSR